MDTFFHFWSQTCISVLFLTGHTVTMMLITLSVLNMPLPQEQKLALQSRSKDSHLNQLGEVEKRFSALSRQCAMIKQAHEKLEENGNE